jgi:hypothetical protein
MVVAVPMTPSAVLLIRLTPPLMNRCPPLFISVGLLISALAGSKKKSLTPTPSEDSRPTGFPTRSKEPTILYI